MPDKCRKCDGCGQVANTNRQEPWTAWTELPVRSAALAGLVRPIPCPECGGTGEAEAEAQAEPEDVAAEQAEVVEECCKAVCLYCLEGFPLDPNGHDCHRWRDEEGKRHSAPCRAARIRLRMARHLGPAALARTREGVS